jgi:hypothetical protein
MTRNDENLYLAEIETKGHVLHVHPFGEIEEQKTCQGAHQCGNQRFPEMGVAPASLQQVSFGC